MTDLKVPLKEVERHGRKHTVLLTGGTSYVAGHILHRLLANEIHVRSSSHTVPTYFSLIVGEVTLAWLAQVHATVRDPSNESKVKFLKSLPNGDTHLKLFKADL